MPPFLPRTHLERGMDHHAAHEAHLREQREEMRDDTEVFSAQKFLENSADERRKKLDKIWDEFTSILFSNSRDEESFYNGDDDYSFSDLQRQYERSRSVEEGVGSIVQYLSEKIRHPDVMPSQGMFDQPYRPVFRGGGYDEDDEEFYPRRRVIEAPVISKEAVDQARGLAKRRLERFLRAVDPFFLDSAELKEHVVSALLLERELGVLKTHFHKESFSKKEATQAFKGFVQGELFRADELNIEEELDTLEKSLGVSPNWYDPGLEKTILDTYEKLLRSAGTGESWERFCALVEYSGIDPADLEPPYKGLGGALGRLQWYIAEKGELARAAEVEQFTGQAFPSHVRITLLKNAFRDSCIAFQYDLTHSDGSVLETKFEQLFTDFFAQGGQELSIAERGSTIRPVLQKAMSALEGSDPVRSILNFEWFLRKVVDRLGIPLSFFKQQLAPDFQDFYTGQRYKRVFFSEERQAFLERIEQFTGVYQEPLRPELEKLYVLKALQNPLFFTEGNATTRIGPYLAARLPSLISLPGARDELIQAANKGLQSLARRTENAFLLEQLQDYHEAGLPVHLDTQSIEMWIGFRVKREGLLVDPLAYAEGFDCRVRQGYERAYERYIGEGYEQKTERGQFAKQVLIAYFKHRGEWGWTGVAAALEADSSDIPPEEKFQVIRNLIHGLAIPTIKLNTKRSFHQPSRITVERSINTPAIRFFEGILALPFSDEQKNHLTQEAYALYALQNSVFLDTDLLEGLLPLQLDHPSVIAARARLTKSCLVEERPITIDEPFHMRPALLPPSEWTEAQFEEYTTVIKHLNERHYKEIIQEFREWHETDKSLANRLMEIFWQWREGHLDDSRLEQTLIMNNAKIQIFRKNSGEFQEAFEGLLAEHISRGEWTLEQAQRRFRNPEEEFSLRMCEEIVITTVRTGNWFAIEALLKRYPDREKELIIWVKREVGERLAAELKRSTNSPTQPWLAYVIAHHSDVLIVEQSKEDFPWNEYQICLSHLYGKDKLPSELFLKIPGIDLRHPVLQEAIATDVLLNILNKGLKVVAAEAAFIDWANPEIQALSDRVSQSYFPSLKVLKARETEPGALESDLGKLRLFQETTGYFVSDPRFWDLHRDDRISGIGEGIEHWERLASLLGEKPGAREAIRKAAQDILDRLCKLGGGVIAEFAALQKEYHLTPSDESLRLAVVDGLRPGRSLTRSVELLKALGRSVEFSVENIRQIPLTEPRAEALIYTTLLPKSGPDRAAAEKAYKERSPLAALIPQLLAIQGPTKRDEFCPYVHGFTPFMGQITFREEVQNKGLLLYFKEFGMRYSPLLAWSIIELVERLEGVVSVRGSHHLDALNTLLGVGEEKWTLEQYLQKMHELIATIRQTILEDVSLDPRVEKSALGMELFNAVVPHTGSYQSVEDRPALLALTRVNQEGLVLGPWYTPGSKLVNVAEQEQVSLQDQGGSLVDRQIAARKEQLKKKYQDETMQRFVRGWEEALEMLRLEPTAQSRPYWFAFIRDRFQRQLVTLEEKQAETENIKGKAALEKKMERLRQMDTRIAALLNRDSDPEFATPSVETLFEELQSLFVTTNGKVDRVELEAQVGDIARVFTIALLRGHSPAHYEAVCEAQADKTEQASPALLTAWERWFREEYLEHFAGFNPEVDQPLTSSTRFLLQKLWRIDGLEQDILKMQSGEETKGVNGHPFIGPFTIIRRLQQEIDQLERTQQTGNQKPLQFWPVKRIGRVLAGDIANACYNQHRRSLASGEYRRLTALLMTIPGEMELAGSTLLIDTKTRSGKRVLVIRALNPTEAIIRKALDARSVVEATIDYVKDVALSTQGSPQPIQEIRLCVDHRGGHSTNREEVFNAEAALVAKHGWKHGEALEDVSETRFNGYNIQDASQTRVVWRVKHP